MNKRPASSPYQPKLTRACRACVKAKRKCSFDLPKCARCQRRETLCEYENQPLTQQDFRPKLKSYGEDERWRLAPALPTNAISDESFNSCPSLSCIRLAEPICTLTIDGRSFSYQNNQLKKHLISFGQTGTTTFIHPKTPVSSLLTEVQALTTALTSDLASAGTVSLQALPRDHMHLLNHTMRTLISALPTLHSYENLLPFTQSLILVQILTQFVIPASLLPRWLLQTSEARQKLLKRATQRLWELAPTHLPSHLSRHEAYALAESIRRTVIMSHELQAQCSLCKRGFFEYGLFGASLPFDRRFELWDANTYEFDEAIDAPGREHGPQYMVSYREFCDMFDRMEIASIDKPFETMILVGAKGLDHVEQRYGVHLA